MKALCIRSIDRFQSGCVYDVIYRATSYTKIDSGYKRTERCRNTETVVFGSKRCLEYFQFLTELEVDALRYNL